MERIVRGLEHDLVLRPRLDLRKLYLELTTRCNYRCPFCFRRGMEEPEGDMSWEVFQGVLTGLEGLPELEEVVLGGMGEPAIHPRFREAVSLLAKRVSRVVLSTNGRSLDRELISYIVGCGVSKVYFSVDMAEIGHPGSEEAFRAMEGVSEEVLRQGTGRPSVGAEVVLCRQNLQELPLLAERLLDCGVVEAVLSNLLPVTPEMVPFALYDGGVEEAEGALEAFLERTTGRMSVTVPNLRLLTERHCGFIEGRSAVVSWRGVVHPCYRFLHRGVEYVFGRRKEVYPYSFGTVGEGLATAWLSPDYAYFRYRVRNALFPSCTDCKLREVCQFAPTTERDCWGNSPSCADCLWWRGVVLCP